MGIVKMEFTKEEHEIMEEWLNTLVIQKEKDRALVMLQKIYSDYGLEVPKENSTEEMMFYSFIDGYKQGKRSGNNYLPNGDYDFTITSFQRGRFEGSSRIKPCAKAILELEINYNGNTFTIEEELILNIKRECKLSEFFISIGLKEPGQPVRMDWSKVRGATGRCRIEDKRIKTFLEPTHK